MVPTGLVPAVLFHGDEGGDESETSTSRELVWESDAILEALDAKFPDTPQLMKKGDKAFDDALDLQNRLQSAGFKFAYGNRNGTLTDEEIQKTRDDFESVLDELDAALGEHASAAGTEKCFRLGTEFSGVDAIMVPTLERWRYQLTITENLDILENRNHLKNWFDTMESYEAYGGRVAGDEYSWTATASMFLRYFGGGEDKPKVVEGIAKADAAAEKLAGEFVSTSAESSHQQEAALEAASKLISNHEAVVADCVREEPLSQQHVARATSSGKETADLLLRHVSSVLLHHAAATSPLSYATTDASIKDLLHDSDADATAQGALALQTVSKRLCVPRDMGAPSAALLRGILSSVAENLLVEGVGTKIAAEAVVS
jgi:glutathione S-transferase